MASSQRRSARPPQPRRGTPAVYRRRRLAALVALAGVFLLGLLLLGGGGSEEELSPAQQLQAERAEKPVRFTVSVSGDLLIHSPLFYRALELGGGSSYDFAPMLAELRPYVAEADLALCHLETPVSDEPPTSYPIFSAPAELAGAVRATGWDACDTASNHSLDGAQDGIDDTTRLLDAAGLEHTGSFSSPRERREPLVLDVDGVKVGLVAYTDMTNGIPPPSPWSVNVSDDPGDAEQILADARRAREAGAEAVLVNMHWGDEYATEPNEFQLELADRLTRSPLITAVVGQGPHVVQPIRKVNGKFVVFSEGNLISNQSSLAGLPAESQYGFVALLEMVADGSGVQVERVRYVPTWVRLSDYVVLPVANGVEEDPANAPYMEEAYDVVVDIAGRGRGVEPIPPRL